MRWRSAGNNIRIIHSHRELETMEEIGKIKKKKKKIRINYDRDIMSIAYGVASERGYGGFIARVLFSARRVLV